MVDRDEAVRTLLGIYHRIAQEKDLSPDNTIITDTLKGFIAFLRSIYHEPWAFDLPNDPKLTEVLAYLPALCGKAEVEMEKWWCRRFVFDTALTFQSLESFWYYHNYRYLVFDELSLIRHLSMKRIVFLGSGALPLTALLLSRHLTDQRIICVDQDQEACALSTLLIKKLNLSERLTVIKSSAETYMYHNSDIIICACLLAAPRLLQTFTDARIKTFILRDVAGLFRLCYRKAPIVPSKYKIVAQKNSAPYSINTSRLYHFAEQVMPVL